jgi:hypothetical protein
MTPQELQQRIALAEAIAAIGRLLPAGMEVRFFRPAGDHNVVIESRYPNGELTQHRFTQAIH